LKNQKEERKGMNCNVQLILKCLFDILVSATVLTLLSPLMALIALAIKLDDGGPVLYADKRAGKDGKAFNLYKFRSMVVGADKIGLGRAVAKGDPRITPVGKLLRQFTLDELPQFFNVLKGDMSVVGPRPGTPAQAERYDDFERRRLEMRPGMTGWAWIHGRNDLPWEERIKLDAWYIDHWSLWLDLRILAKTPLMVLKREGLYGKQGVTPNFKGF
jgi:lipopolysaccharide/colanic/teichoic acid biosynthesis glycosyltransferase